MKSIDISRSNARPDDLIPDARDWIIVRLVSGGAGPNRFVGPDIAPAKAFMEKRLGRAQCIAMAKQLREELP